MVGRLAGLLRTFAAGRANGRSASSADVEMGSEWRATRDDGREPVRHRQCYMSTEPHHCITSASFNSEANHPRPPPLNCTTPACCCFPRLSCDLRLTLAALLYPRRTGLLVPKPWPLCTSRSGCAKSKAGNVCGVRDDDVSWCQAGNGKTPDSRLKRPLCAGPSAVLLPKTRPRAQQYTVASAPRMRRDKGSLLEHHRFTPSTAPSRWQWQRQWQYSTSSSSQPDTHILDLLLTLAIILLPELFGRGYILAVCPIYSTRRRSTMADAIVYPLQS